MLRPSKKSALVVLLVFFCAMAAGIVVDGLSDDTRVSDVGIVLGSKVMRDGKPSHRLQARLDRAAELYEQGVFKQVIVSGGTGVEGFSEAKVMADYLAEQRGVPRAAILLDEHGDNTEATARNSAALMRAHNLRSALVVSQYFHITRCRLALQHAGILAIGTAHARYFEMRDIYSTAREMAALPSYWLGLRFGSAG